MRRQALSLTAKRIERLVSPTNGQLGEHKDGQTTGLLLLVQRFAEKDRPPSAS